MRNLNHDQAPRLDHSREPKLTYHLRQRCEEMEVAVTTVLAMFRNPSVVRPARPKPGQAFPENPRHIVKSDEAPGYALCVALHPDGTPAIMSLLFDTGTAAYVRQGTTAQTIQENQP